MNSAGPKPTSEDQGPQKSIERLPSSQNLARTMAWWAVGPCVLAVTMIRWEVEAVVPGTDMEIGTRAAALPRV